MEVVLKAQGDSDGVAGFLKSDEAAVAGVAEQFVADDGGERIAQQLMVVGEQLAIGRGPKPLSVRDGPDDVGEHQRHQARCGQLISQW